MNEFRAALSRGEAAQIASPVATKEKCRRRSRGGMDGVSLSGRLVPREERRRTDQRREQRFRGLVDRATLHFRRKAVLVKVVNISGGGLMVEAPIAPMIGEAIGVEFDGFELLAGHVRWMRDGRIGIDLGDGAIALDESREA
jgi:hypothetical protein